MGLAQEDKDESLKSLIPNSCFLIPDLIYCIMESTRQAKISRLLQKELSEIFRQQTAKTHGTIVSLSLIHI